MYTLIWQLNFTDTASQSFSQPFSKQLKFPSKTLEKKSGESNGCRAAVGKWWYVFWVLRRSCAAVGSYAQTRMAAASVELVLITEIDLWRRKQAAAAKIFNNIFFLGSCALRSRIEAVSSEHRSSLSLRSNSPVSSPYTASTRNHTLWASYVFFSWCNSRVSISYEVSFFSPSKFIGGLKKKILKWKMNINSSADSEIGESGNEFFSCLRRRGCTCEIYMPWNDAPKNDSTQNTILMPKKWVLLRIKCEYMTR